MDKRAFKLSEVIVVIVITALFSAVVAGFVSYYTFTKNKEEGYVNLTDDQDLKEFLEVYASLVSDYYEDVDRKELLSSAITAMTNYLGESYTTHLNEETTTELMNQLSGKYEGIGVSVRIDKSIASVFDNSPAKKAGLMEEDIIVAINDEDVTEKSSEDVVNIIKNTKEANFKIKVLRGTEEKTFEIKRESIDIPSISGDIDEESKVGYIYISTFSNTTASQFSNKLIELESKGIKSLIVDVRSNNGGYLLSAKQIASLFIEYGKTIYSLQDKNKTTDFVDETKEKRNYPVVVLINGNSASAAEILAGALKDSYGATLVGEKSYGKGKVQQTKELDDGSLVKYTSAKWLRPNGECIDGKGLIPDYEVNLTINENKEVIDSQYNKALELLK